MGADEKKEKETTLQMLQKHISEGRTVLIVGKEEGKTLVRIRYNNTDTDGTKKWRVIIDGNEYHTSEIYINCQSKTLSENIQEIGEKHHIVCYANRVEFLKNIANIY